mmetsp:Transcript_2855/g.7406  ORF Transcript_2855/g.7406 Transcript_2855/m.7406 type:complete len:232 (-) Transcript_2855:690-1385(-)
MRAARCPILASRSSFTSFFSKVSFSLWFSSLVQYALNFTSSSCSSLSAATILSIISLTFVNESSCTAMASVESCARGPREAPSAGCRPPRPCHAARRSSASRVSSSAARRSIAAARTLLLRDVADACNRLTPFASISRLSSSVMTAMASATAWVSAARVLLRFSHCASRSPQVTFRFCRKSTSLERCSRVSARSSLASESAFWFAASSACMSSSFFFATSICSSLAAASTL